MALLSALFILALISTSTANNKVNGDQNVGGLHFFEFHSTSGGMGLGFKIAIVLLIAICLAYYCIRRRAKKFMRKSLLGNVLTSVTSTQPMAPNQQLNAQLPPQQQPYQLVVRPPRRTHRHRGYSSDSEVSGHVRHHRRDQSQ